jgi:hypothetical protein
VLLRLADNCRPRPPDRRGLVVAHNHVIELFESHREKSHLAFPPASIASSSAALDGTRSIRAADAVSIHKNRRARSWRKNIRTFAVAPEGVFWWDDAVRRLQQAD